MNSRWSLKQVGWWRLMIAAVAVGLIAYCALRDSPRMTSIWWVPDSVGRWADRHYVLRNLPAFAGMAVVVLAALGSYLPVLCGLLAIATGLEVAQLWIPRRVFDWQDIAVSILGVLAGAVVFAVARRVWAWTRLRLHPLPPRP